MTFPSMNLLLGLNELIFKVEMTFPSMNLLLGLNELIFKVEMTFPSMNLLLGSFFQNQNFLNSDKSIVTVFFLPSLAVFVRSGERQL